MDKKTAKELYDSGLLTKEEYQKYTSDKYQNDAYNQRSYEAFHDSHKDHRFGDKSNENKYTFETHNENGKRGFTFKTTKRSVNSVKKDLNMEELVNMMSSVTAMGATSLVKGIKEASKNMSEEIMNSPDISDEDKEKLLKFTMKIK